MPKNIIIKAGKVTVEGELYDTPTARSIISKLPITAQARRWGEEIYFPIPVKALLEKDSRDVLEAGELGYWPTGNAFCIFFGLTPASEADEIRAASAVNVIGKIKGDLSGLSNVSDSDPVSIEPA